MLAGQIFGTLPARLDSYATLVTTALDTAIIAPAAVLAGGLILRRHAFGYIMAVPLLVGGIAAGAGHHSPDGSSDLVGHLPVNCRDHRPHCNFRRVGRAAG